MPVEVIVNSLCDVIVGYLTQRSHTATSLAHIGLVLADDNSVNLFRHLFVKRLEETGRLDVNNMTHAEAAGGLPSNERTSDLDIRRKMFALRLASTQ